MRKRRSPRSHGVRECLVRLAQKAALLLPAAPISLCGGLDSTSHPPEKSWAVVSGAEPDIRFQALTRADGVPTKQFYHMLQDQRGFIWFATRDGLVRYDGYRSVTYPGLPMTRIPPKTPSVPGRSAFGAPHKAAAPLRQELADSVVSLDRARIAVAIARIAELDAALAEVQRGIHDRLAYTAMLAILERSRPESVDARSEDPRTTTASAR